MTHDRQTWYTLAVVDEEGDIAGRKGVAIAPSRAIEVVRDWERACVGDAVRTRDLPYIPQGDTLRLVARDATEDALMATADFPPSLPLVPCIRTFQRCWLAHKKTHKTLRRKALEAWERIE